MKDMKVTFIGKFSNMKRCFSSILVSPSLVSLLNRYVAYKTNYWKAEVRHVNSRGKLLMTEIVMLTVCVCHFQFCT